MTKARIAAALGLTAWTLVSCAPTPVPLEPAARQAQQTFHTGMVPQRHPPVVAVLALNAGTETTDFLVPHAVLQRSGLAVVEAVAPQRGRVNLMPALAVEVQRDLDDFDRIHPEGADYVIVPAMHTDDDPVILAWLRSQADKGARLIGICAGVRVLGQAGLLDGREFTGHWYDRGTLKRRHPLARHRPNQRYWADGPIVTTTGVTASLPVALALVEALGGTARTTDLAQALGVEDWSARHTSAAFGVSVGGAWTMAWNTLRPWRHERHAIAVQDGADDIALAMSADAWSRTYRSQAVAVSTTSAPVVLHSGLRLLPEPPRPDDVAHGELSLQRPACQLARTLDAIAHRYGVATRDWVMTEMEYRAPESSGALCGG